jgi:hypothetical protein
MDVETKRLNRLNELIAWHAHPEAIREFVANVEAQFIKEADQLLEQGSYELAIRKYFFALLLPDRSFRREYLLERCVYAYDLLRKKGKDLNDFDSLADATFADLKAGLKRKWDEKTNSVVGARFGNLDSEPSLFEKQFEELETLLEELPLTADGRLLAELRLPREKVAQQLLIKTRDLLREISKESDPEKRKQMIATDVQSLKQQIFGFASGSNSNYFQQASDYITKAEKLLVETEVEMLIDNINRDSQRLREERFGVFKETLISGTDELSVLRAICAGLKDFRDEEQLESVKKVSIHWTKEYGMFRYRRMVTEDPDHARQLIGDSLALLEENKEELPAEIAVDFNNFLQGLAAVIGPPPAEVVIEPAAAAQASVITQDSWGVRFRRWVGRIFQKR